MDSEKQIDRYHVVDRLAIGGMAEILLGKLFGPAGFERAVVIKRMLAHLLDDRPESASMLYDEARLVAAIDHDNVVRVTDVGVDDGTVYLVMDYLEGESLSGLTRRLMDVDRLLPPELCAYIIASACAGLHAAHELRGADGEPLGVVHRDVSPQNLFVTYDGRVKVLDFGIAKARGRLEKTETGVVKGKFSYMSPEQCLGQPVDRRTDVFACGVCLYELLTRRRLFRRATVPATVRALLDRPIVPVRELREDVPPRLERIVMRALERDLSRRYESCAALRRDLLDAIADAGGLDERLAAEMHALFSDRVELKRAMVRSLRAGEPVVPVPAEADLHVELTDVTVAAPKPKKRSLLIGGGLVAVGVAGALLGALFLVDPKETPPVAPEAAAESIEVSERDEPHTGVAAEPPPSDDVVTASAADPVATPLVPDGASEPEEPEPRVDDDARPRRERAARLRVRQTAPAAAASAPPEEIPQFH